MKKFKVRVVRVLTSYRDIFVEAKDANKAEAKAFEKAKGLEFTQHYSDTPFSHNPEYKLGNIENANKKQIKKGDKFRIDTDRVSQYEGERVADTVQVIEKPKKNAKKVLVYSGSLRANVLVFISDLKS